MNGRIANMDLNLLVPLQALLRERNITRAARHVGVTQPAMSNALRRIRVLLDDPLLVRSRSGYELTPRAEMIGDAVDDALGLIASRILEEPLFDPARTTRRFKVAASSATVYSALRPVLAASARMNKGISFQLVALTRAVDRLLDQPDLDLVLAPEVLPTEHTRERLFDESWVLVVSADNRLVGDRATLDDLVNLGHVIYEAEGLRTHADLALAAVDDHYRTVVTCSDFLTLFHLIAGSPMIGFVQETVALSLGRANGVRIVESPIPLPGFGIDIVRNPRRAADPAVDWLVAELRDAQVGGPSRRTHEEDASPRGSR